MRSRSRNRSTHMLWDPRHLLKGGQGQQWDLGCPILTGYPGGTLQSISKGGVPLTTVGGTSPGLITTVHGSGLNVVANNTTRAPFSQEGLTKMRIFLAFSLSASTQFNGGIASLYGGGGADYESGKWVINRVGTTAAFEFYSGGSLFSSSIVYDEATLIEVCFDGTNCSVWKNGVSLGEVTKTINTNVTGGIQIAGREFDSPTYSMRGIFYECLAFKSDLPRDYKKVQGYLMHKRSIADHLPASHPFRYKPPMMGDTE